jgi:hypothetical protein
MMKRLALLVASGAALLTVAAADAQRPKGPMGPPGALGPAGFGLLEFDANADGRLTRAEFDAAQKARFDRIDANEDGSATPEEARAGQEAMARERMAEAQKARFTALDTDKNGQLSQAEFLAGAQDRGPRGPGPALAFARGGPDGPGFGGPGFGGPGSGRERGPRGPGADGQPPLPPRANRADTDGNGSISLAEFSARGVEAFTRADTDKNGVVTIAELQKLSGGPR